MASKLAGTAADKINFGWSELFASPSKANRSSFKRLT